jgi:phosphate transport system permease protein
VANRLPEPAVGTAAAAPVRTARAHASSALDHRDVAFWSDWIARVLVFVGGISAILFIAAIFVFIFTQGAEIAVHRLDWREFFTSPAWRPTAEHPTYGALALLAGTGSVTVLAMVVAVPFSLGAAIYIGEFATGKKREWLKITIEMLAAIPSVVWGFIGLSVMSPLIVDVFEPDPPIGLNMLNAGIVLGLMAAPIMTTIAEDALKAVPDAYREAAEALGATAKGSDHYQALFVLGVVLFVITFVINLTADACIRGIRRGNR